MPKGGRKKFYGHNAASASQGAALAMAGQLRLILGDLGITQHVTTAPYKGNAQEYWAAYFPAPILINSPRQGAWSLTSYWRYVADPRETDHAILLESSVGLNVSDHPLEGSEDEVCVVRYDLDRTRTPALHLNVLQPGPIQDRAHWSLPSNEIKEWDARLVFTYLVTDAFDDLRKANWP